MAGWTCTDRETVEWDGTLKAKHLKYGNQDTDDRYIKVSTLSQTQPARALNTVYQNITGNNLVVYGSVDIACQDDNLPSFAYITCKTGASSPPTTDRMKAGFVINNFLVVSNSVREEEFTFYFVVPNNHYYSINTTVNGSGAVNAFGTLIWNEVNMTVIPA